MAKLMPPIFLHNLVLADLINGPEMTAVFAEKDGLKDGLLKRLRRHLGVLVHAELVQVVCAVEAHLDLARILVVAVGKVHGRKPPGSSLGPGSHSWQT